MAKTPSNMVPLGTVAPSFNLLNVTTNKKVSLDDLKSDQATLIMFICNHCPFVKHIQAELVRLANDYTPKGISFIAINSNDIETHPDDSPENMQEIAATHQYPFPYLFDESQQVAKNYDATCTPDFFIFDGNLKLVYRGELDDSRPGNGIPVTGSAIRTALDDILSGRTISVTQKPSLGCNIKWKKETV